MKQEEYTPGPWMYRTPEVGPNTPKGERELWPFHIDKKGTPNRMAAGILIAKCWAHAPGSAEANARLIAKAPEMHEQLAALASLLSCKPEEVRGRVEEWRKALEHYADAANWDSEYECSVGGEETTTISMYGGIRRIMDGNEHGFEKAAAALRQAHAETPGRGSNG